MKVASRVETLALERRSLEDVERREGCSRRAMDAIVGKLLAEFSASPAAFVSTCVTGIAVALFLKLIASEVVVSIRCRHIPSPKGRVPLLGHALKLLKGNVWDTFTEYAKDFGAIYRMHVLGRVYVVLSDPKHIKYVLSTNLKNYRKDRGSYEVFDCLLGTGIVTSEGDRWHRLRRELAPTFKLEILEDVARAAEEVTVRLCKVLDKACESGDVVDIAEHFRKLTLQVIALAVLGCTPEESDSEISDLYMPIIDECNDRIWYPHRIYLPSPAWWKHKRLVRNLNQYLEGKVRSRWAERLSRDEQGLGQKPPKDILDRILASVDTDQFRHNGVQDLRDGLKTFLFAGHDTTSCMLTWTIWELMQSPAVMEQAVAESRSFFADGAVSKPDFAAVQCCLPFMFNCLRETLRLHSPVPVVTREVGHTIDQTKDSYHPLDFLYGGICIDILYARGWLQPRPDLGTSIPQPGVADQEELFCIGYISRSRY